MRTDNFTVVCGREKHYMLCRGEIRGLIFAATPWHRKGCVFNAAIAAAVNELTSFPDN